MYINDIKSYSDLRNIEIPIIKPDSILSYPYFRGEELNYDQTFMLTLAISYKKYLKILYLQ